MGSAIPDTKAARGREEIGLGAGPWAGPRRGGAGGRAEEGAGQSLKGGAWLRKGGAGGGLRSEGGGAGLKRERG